MTDETETVKRGRGRPKKSPAPKKQSRRVGRKPVGVDSRSVAERKKQALAAYYEFGTICRACKVAKIARSTWWTWTQQDPEFKRDAADAALDIADDLEEEAIRRAKHDSDTMLIFLLKGQKPEKYSDKLRTEHTGKDGGPIQIDKLSLAERMLMREEIEAEIKRRGLLTDKTK